MACTRREALVGSLSTSLLVAPAYGGSPTSDDSGDGAAAGVEDDADESPFAPLYAELADLDDHARHDALAELAREEGELVNYSTNTSMERVTPRFEETYDLGVGIWRAQSQNVSRRVHQEAVAGNLRCDVVDNTAEHMLAADEAGLLAVYEGPVHNGLPDIAVGAGFLANQYTAFAVAWNSDRVTEQERPSSYEDLADPRWSGDLLVDLRHDAMFFALHHHLESQGWSEAQIRDLFGRIGEGAVLLEGGTPRANSLLSGEHAVGIGSFIHEVDDQAESGAPISWEPAVQPIYVEPVGSGLAASAPHPAAALLFYEWVAAGAGQAAMASVARVTTDEFVEGGRLAPIDVLEINYAEYAEEGEHWESLFHELIGYA